MGVDHLQACPPSGPSFVRLLGCLASHGQTVGREDQTVESELVVALSSPE